MGSEEADQPEIAFGEPILAELVENHVGVTLAEPIPLATIAAEDETHIDVFSAPRRFDLATLFVVSIAYSVLFATVRAVNWGIMANALLGGLVTITGLAQAVLFHGEKPRFASVLAGAAYGPIAITIYSYSFRRPPDTDELVVNAIMSIPLGAMFGYLAGAMVGGVFLTAHHIRKRFADRRTAAAEA